MATSDHPIDSAEPLSLDGHRMLAETRRRAIADELRARGSMTVAYLEARFGISPATARRDLAELERRSLARRTHRGAFLSATPAPATSRASDESSFARRLEESADAKRRLAEVAIGLLQSGQTVFLDSSPTSYTLAWRLLELRLDVTLLTNCLPIMQLVYDQPQAAAGLVALGGALRPLTGSFVGPIATRAVSCHFADHLFLGVKGVTDSGVMTEADTLEAEVKRAMMVQANSATLLLDRSKLSARGLSAVASLSDLESVIVHGISDADIERLRSAHAELSVLTTESG